MDSWKKWPLPNYLSQFLNFGDSLLTISVAQLPENGARKLTDPIRTDKKVVYHVYDVLGWFFSRLHQQFPITSRTARVFRVGNLCFRLFLVRQLTQRSIPVQVSSRGKETAGNSLTFLAGFFPLLCFSGMVFIPSS